MRDICVPMHHYLIVCALFIVASMATAQPVTQPVSSAFYPKPVLQRVRANIERDEWGKEIKRRAIEGAKHWQEMSDEQLWELPFGATLPRSWHVFSNGFCPNCKQPVPMYDWQIDGDERPWKLRCP